MRKPNLIFLIVFSIAIFFFALRGTIFLDPDFGWHLRMGQIIVAQGIPSTDPFSYTMPSFSLVDHEWLTEVILALFFPIVRYSGLSLLFAFFAVIALSLPILQVEKKLGIPIFLLASLTVISSSGIRVQVLSWLFLAFLFFFLSHEKLWNRWRFFIPLLFIMWANMHGAFVAGLLLLSIWISSGMLKKRKFMWGNIVILFTSFFVTFINPFGSHLWSSILAQSADPYVRVYVQEWLPSIFSKNVFLWVYLALSGFLLIRYYRRFLLQELVVYTVFLILGIVSMRHMPLWILISLPITIKAISHFSKEASAVKYGAKRFLVGYLFFFGITFVLGLPYMWSVYSESRALSEAHYYPTETVAYLQKHPPAKQIFSPYEWNGYLLWKFSLKKVFVYGMMPSWRWNYQGSRESSYAFKDYNEILFGNMPFKNVATRYTIDTVVLPVQGREEAGVITPGFFASSNHPIMTNKQPLTLEEQVKEMGWVVVYKDQKSIIYQQK